MNPLFYTDFYKIDHRRQYPEGTTSVYSNFTARKSRIEGVNSVVFFGLQAVIQRMHNAFCEDFFERERCEVVDEYKHLIQNTLRHDLTVDHIAALHDLGYLPIKIKALPEGSLVPIGTPLCTIVNTHDDFFWLTNYIESYLSAEMWKMPTVATISREFRKLFNEFAAETDPEGCTDYQGHDFSLRGMSGIDDAMACGAAHLLFSKGTDCVPALKFIQDHYLTTRYVGGSVPATEHSVMCADDEWGTVIRLIDEVYPTGILSIVADSYDFWEFVGTLLPSIKNKILARDGKIVVRPDSGNPVDILCGVEVETIDVTGLGDAKAWACESLYELAAVEPHGQHGKHAYRGYFNWQGQVYEAVLSVEWNRYDKRFYYVDGHEITSFEPVELTWEQKGLIESLHEIFGGTFSSKGFKLLNDHIGAIYGDSITLPIAKQIFERLVAKGFASTNVVLGIGSYTYQYNTRDTFGFVCKATHCVINDADRPIFKSPKTGAWKKSHKGLLRVNADFSYTECCTWEEEQQGLLKTVYYNGDIILEGWQAISERAMATL